MAKNPFLAHVYQELVNARKIIKDNQFRRKPQIKKFFQKYVKEGQFAGKKFKVNQLNSTPIKTGNFIASKNSEIIIQKIRKI